MKQLFLLIVIVALSGCYTQVLPPSEDIDYNSTVTNNVNLFTTSNATYSYWDPWWEPPTIRFGSMWPNHYSCYPYQWGGGLWYPYAPSDSYIGEIVTEDKKEGRGFGRNRNIIPVAPPGIGGTGVGSGFQAVAPINIEQDRIASASSSNISIPQPKKEEKLKPVNKKRNTPPIVKTKEIKQRKVIKSVKTKTVTPVPKEKKKPEEKPSIKRRR